MGNVFLTKSVLKVILRSAHVVCFRLSVSECYSTTELRAKQWL